MFITDPDLDFLPIPDQGSKMQKQKGTGSQVRNTDWKYARQILNGDKPHDLQPFNIAVQVHTEVAIAI
jgi:hypothetical protein